MILEAVIMEYKYVFLIFERKVHVGTGLATCPEILNFL